MYTSDDESDFVPDFIESKGKASRIRIPERITEGRDVPPSPTEGSFLCLVCGDLFKRMMNFDDACQFHYGQWSKELELWTCCEKPKLSSGCRRGRHQDSEKMVLCEFCLRKVKARDLATHQQEECLTFPRSPQAHQTGSTMCERCNHVFARNANRESSCTFHPGQLEYPSSKAVFRQWSCCGVKEGKESEYSRGCKQSFHLDANRKISCKYCSKRISVREMDKHLLEQCTKSPQRTLIACTYCKAQVPRAGLDRHHQTSCPNFPSVNCPNRKDGCPLQMLQSEIGKHLETCMFRKVPCPFRQAGCTSMVSHNKIESHISSDLSSHLLMMWNLFEVMGQRVATLEAENEALRGEARQNK